MSYEDAPATELLATHCGCCNRPLVDAKSVQAGIGPECRKRHGYGETQSPANFELAATRLGEALPHAGDAHASANVLVHRVAAERSGVGVDRAIAAIAALGYTKLAARLTERLKADVVVVTVEREGDQYVIRTPKLADDVFARYTSAMRALAPWNANRKVREAPVDRAQALFAALKGSLPKGSMIAGAKGCVTV